jgi:N-methylhydantoinase A
MAGRLGELIDADRLRIEAFLDMRYAGQDFTLPVPVDQDDLAADGPGRIRRRFDEVHQRRYGHHAADERAEVVNLRVTGFGSREKPALVDAARRADAPPSPDHALVHFEAGAEAISAPIYARDELSPGHEFEGPALVEEYASTTVVFAGDLVTVADNLELVIDVRSKHA